MVNTVMFAHVGLLVVFATGRGYLRTWRNKDVGGPRTEDTKRKVAVLSIHPPSMVLPAMCKVESSISLLDDDNPPISLCLVGGLRAKIEKFCGQHKAHGRSETGHYVLRVMFGFLVVFLGLGWVAEATGLSVWLDERVSQRVLTTCWSLGSIGLLVSCCNEHEIHASSQKYQDSKRVFWRAWQASGLQEELSDTLLACGYSYEIEAMERCWTMSLSKVGGKQALPETTLASTKEEKDEDEERPTNTAVCSYIQVEYLRKFPPNIDAAPCLSLLDSWTLNGLLLGIHLNMQEKTRRTVVLINSLFVFFTFPVAWLLLFKGNILLGLACIPGFATPYHVLLWAFVNLWVVVPQVYSANRKLVTRLSTLTQGRHSCTLEYKIEAWANYGWFPRGTIVVHPLTRRLEKIER